MGMDVIDYDIRGAEMQFVELELDPGEAGIGEAGSMMFMDAGISMDTVFGDGSAQQGGFFGKLLGAGKRLVTGESLVTTIYTNQSSNKQRVAFAAPYPGKILPMDLRQLGGTLICQKDAFLCEARGVSLGIALQQKMSTGFFGGEGFIMQKLEGDGMAFLHAGGTMHKRELKPGEVLRVDTGCLVGLQPSVEYDIQMVPGIKKALFGGEGFGVPADLLDAGFDLVCDGAVGGAGFALLDSLGLDPGGDLFEPLGDLDEGEVGDGALIRPLGQVGVGVGAVDLHRWVPYGLWSLASGLGEACLWGCLVVISVLRPPL